MDNKSERMEKVVDGLRLRRHSKNASEWKVEEEEMEQMTGRSERHGGRGRCAIGLGTVVQYGGGIKLWKARGESKARIVARSELEGSHSAMAEGGFAP